MMNFNDIVEYCRNTRSAADDKTALIGKEFYPFWDDIPNGAEIKEGTRVQHPKENSLLYRCNEGKTHNKVESQPPSIHTASIWTVINEEHAGTIEDPIPVPEQLTSFEYEWGKYYQEGKTLYLCNRQGGKEGDTYTLAYKPSQQTPHYFKVVE